jgi:cadaverine:lysine antiporter
MAIQKIGLIATTGIVAGNMMGSGIALLPKSLATIGSITVFGWLIATLGALSLAYVFAKLGTINPQSGGPVAYAGEVAPILGYQSGILYYHSTWIGNLAIAVAGVSYFSYFFSALNEWLNSLLATIVVIWIVCIINIVGGVKWIGRLITTGIILMLIPVVLTATIGWFYFSYDTFIANWNVSGKGNSTAIINSVILCLWSFIGLESSSVEANLVKNPKKTIPLSTLIATLITAVLYILSSTSILGMFSVANLAKSTAPFADSARVILGSWAPPYISAITAFVCFACLASWMMLTAEAGARSAREGYFPKSYGIRNKQGILTKGILIESIHMTVLLLLVALFKHNSNTTLDIFGALISIAGLTVLLPYFYSCLNLRSRLKLSIQYLAPLATCFIGCMFCLIAFYSAKGSGLSEALLIYIFILFFYARWSSRHDNKLYFPKVSSSHDDDDINTNKVIK